MKETFLKGVFGTVVPITAAVTLQTAEVWLRLTSLALGCIVGVLTVIGLVKRMWRADD